MEKDSPCKQKQKPGVSQIKYFKTKTVIKDKKGYYIIIKKVSTVERYKIYKMFIKYLCI